MAQRLQNQGIPIGSEAYNKEQDRFSRSRGDALENLALSSVGAGRQEQGRLFGQDFASGQFNAGEARRQFGERLGRDLFQRARARARLPGELSLQPEPVQPESSLQSVQRGRVGAQLRRTLCR